MQSNTLELLKEHFSKSNWETMNNILRECYQENRYKITLNLLDIFGYDIRTVYMTCYTIRDILESELFNLNVDLQIKYNKNDIIFYLKESNKMNNLLKINFVIPYGNREDYIEFIEEINNNVKSDEIVFIFANNIPYVLECILYVEVENPDIVRNIAKKYKVSELMNGKSQEYYIKEQSNRGWNSIGLISNMSKEKILMAMRTICQIPTIQEYEEAGYSLKKDYKTVFISYSHKDEKEVEMLEQTIKDNGVRVWRDTYDIDFRDSITQKISEAMKKSHIFLLCISKNTLSSIYAQQEVETLYNTILIQKSNGKRVIPVRLDDVDPNDIIHGLNNFKYCNYKDEKDLKKLIDLLIRETAVEW